MLCGLSGAPSGALVLSRLSEREREATPAVKKSESEDGEEA